MLRAQVLELQSEVSHLEHMFSLQWDVWQSRRVTPQTAMRVAVEELDRMRRLVAESGRDLAAWHDTKQLKAWLKTYRIPEPEDDWYF